MSIAYDIFAETNPAFVTFCVVRFCKKYEASSEQEPAFALLYLAIPLALSDDLAYSFDHTNAATGLLSWLNRYPDVRLDLGSRLDSSKEIVSAALRFGLGARAISLSKDGTIKCDSKCPPATPIEELPSGPRRAIKRAERLGNWMGKAGSAATVFSAFGVTP